MRIRKTAITTAPTTSALLTSASRRSRSTKDCKYKGHTTEWGEAQAKDYTDNHYHQPSDEFVPTWDFAGLAIMTQFGFELGRTAATAPALQGWQPGDEFEPARKQNPNPIGSHLFDLQPQLHIAYYEPVHYPPLSHRHRRG